MAKVVEVYVRDLFTKKVKPVPRDRCGEVIQFPKDKAAVASNTPKTTERHEDNSFAAFGLDALMRSTTGEGSCLPTQSNSEGSSKRTLHAE
jgi:hypothetical protein